MNKQKETFAEKQPLLTFAKSGRCRIAIYIGEETETVSNRIGEEEETTEERTVYAYNVGWLTPEKGVKITNEEEALAAIKADLIAQITAYDTSSAVNGFLLNGSVEWIDIELRMKLCSRTLPEEKKAGNTSTVLWLGNKPYELPIETIEQIMHEIEIYAKACLDVTNSHKAKVLTLSDVSALVAYDYTAGYPEKLSFNI